MRSRFGNFSPSHLESVQTPHGIATRDPRLNTFWARITGGSGCKYTWVKVAEDGSCNTEDLSDQGTLDSWPAVEISGDTGVTTGSIVRLFPSVTDAQYTFSPGGSGGTGFEFAYILDDSPKEPEDSDQIYYNASLPQWDSGTQDWEDPTDGSVEKVWFVPRVKQPCSKGDVIVCRAVGTFDPTVAHNDERTVYAGIRTRCVDPITIQDSNPIDAFGNLYWPARVQYWDNNAQERKEGRECWVIDWLDELQAFRAGDHIVGYWIGESEPGTWVDNFTGFSGSGDGSGSGSDTEHSGPKPLYMTFCSGINTKFIKCFDNQTLARNGTIANIGTRVAFLDENCDEATDFEGICQPGE